MGTKSSSTILCRFSTQEAMKQWGGSRLGSQHRWVTVTLLLLLPLWCHANELATHFVVPHQPDREQQLFSYLEGIRGLDFDYGQVGSILEAIAYLELQERFPPPRYAVVASVQYLNRDRRTLGELDLVILDVDSASVVVLYEAKLTGNPRSAGGRAQSQLNRFRRHLLAGEIDQFIGRRSDPPLNAQMFSEDTPMLRLGSRETEPHGWEVVIDLTREEGDQLQKSLRSN